MFEIIRKIWQTGTVTERRLPGEAPTRYRGKLSIKADKCNNCGACTVACPAAAILIRPKDNGQGQKIVIAYDKCIFCGECAGVCATRAIISTTNFHTATKDKRDLVHIDE